MHSVTTHRLYGDHTTPRDHKLGARDIPFGKGAKSLYVDAASGHPHNDGESWITALDTIQAAVDAASAWSDIFIKAGTYQEAVTINTQKLNLIGERRASVIIAPTSGIALTIAADYCNIHALIAQTTTGSNSILISGIRNLLDVVGINEKNIYITGDHNELSRIKVTSAIPDAIKVAGDYASIHNCLIDAAHTGILITAGNYCNVYENDVKNCITAGIRCHNTSTPKSTYNSIYHNNLTNNTAQVADDGTNNRWFENFYDDHTTDTDHTGIADTAYSFTGGTDYKPVSQRNGWKLHSLGLVPT
jgi:hypothetical protein